jgi:hypothetical protein
MFFTPPFFSVKSTVDPARIGRFIVSENSRVDQRVPDRDLTFDERMDRLEFT